MKKFILLLTAAILMVSITACGENAGINMQDAVEISLSDTGIKVAGADASRDATQAVYVANDIVYYESGKDFTYGEGEEKDAHTAEEAAAHTVVKITKPGTYSLSGKLSKGQIAVDLGEEAEDDKSAVVNLVLNGVDITCDVAPAVIFYNVYECGDDEEERATKDVDTSKAGANVYIANDTVNTVNGAYVARIYEPGTVKLGDDGKTVEDADKLHKYDGAFYSKMSMNINGDSGVLNINAANEGLDSELHLTINGGNININSGNDGINTNEDNVSVTTINGGNLKINVNGSTGEGDGIDSNGWLVINGGTVTAEACSFSGDAGIDSDKGIHINGGTVVATGNMLDRIEDGGATYATFNFAEKQKGNVSAIIMKDKDGEEIFKITPANDYSILIYSSPDLVEGTYTLWSDGTQLAGAAMMFGGRGDRGPGGARPEMPDGMERPEGMEKPEDFDPEKMKPNFNPENAHQDFPDGERPQMPEGEMGRGGFAARENANIELSPEFVIKKGANMFSMIGKMQ